MPRAEAPEVDRLPTAGHVTDVWFRTRLTLPEIADHLELVEWERDGENFWEWVIGSYGGVQLDIMRARECTPADADVCIFLVDGGNYAEDMLSDLAQRLLSVTMGPVFSGQWVYRKGNEFDQVLVRTFEAK